MSPELQLGFDGREVPIAASMSHWHPTQAQRVLLLLARRLEGVTALQAGRYLHNRRLSLGTGSCGRAPTRRGGCCKWASSDGSAALKRLVARGVVEQRRPRGPYFAIIND